LAEVDGRTGQAGDCDGDVLEGEVAPIEAVVGGAAEGVAAHVPGCLVDTFIGAFQGFGVGISIKGVACGAEDAVDLMVDTVFGLWPWGSRRQGVNRHSWQQGG
jgi:hypothetical protein